MGTMIETDIPLLDNTIGGVPSLGQVLPIEAATIMIRWCIERAWDGLTVDVEELFVGFRAFLEDDADDFGVSSLDDDGTDDVSIEPEKPMSKGKGKT